MGIRRIFKDDFVRFLKEKGHLQPYCTNFMIILRLSMKSAVCYILVIIIVGLSTYPCNDSDICVDDQKMSYSILDANDHDHSSSEVDLCTPFCTCSCCCAHLQIPATLSYNLGQSESSARVKFYSSVFVHKLSYSIWQPPRLV